MLDDDNNDLLASSSEIYRDRLYFVAFKRNYKPKNTTNTHYFCIDDDFVYENFYNDFGPLNICMLYRYCQKLSMKLNAKCHAQKRIVHYTSMSPAKRLNAAYLIGSYAIIYLHKTPEEAHRCLTAADVPPYTRYCDASYGPSNFKISLLDCLNAVHKAMMAGFYNFDDFDADEYEYYERVENGDFNWIVPQKFIAFCGPHQLSKTLPNGYPCHSPQTYFEYFRTNNVTTVVRLNAKVYHASSFEHAGFEHKDLFFVDGSTPSDIILRKFLSICETTKGAIAVHCKAGLGRTGSLIGAYMMKHYNFSALEAIAWLRLCRPGSVIGHQQQWMEDKQAWLWSEGERMRKRSGSHPPVHIYGIYSLQLKQRMGGCLAETATMSNENAEILPPLVKGISQRVDTMHLHDRDELLVMPKGINSTAMPAMRSPSTPPPATTPMLATTTSTTVAASTPAGLMLSRNGNLNKIRARSLVATNTHKKDKIGGGGGGSLGAGGQSSVSNSGGSASDYDEVDGETDLSLDDKHSSSTFIISTRRRKSPTLGGITSNMREPGGPLGNGGGSSGGGTPPPTTTTTAAAASTATPAATALLRRTSPVTLEQVLYSEKKLKKPASVYEMTHHKHTIASTVRSTQAAIERKGSQTQGDKLNQIKAMRRQHNSRACLNSLNAEAADLENPLRPTRARSQPFRNNNNNNNNIGNMASGMLTTTTTTTTTMAGGHALPYKLGGASSACGGGGGGPSTSERANCDRINNNNNINGNNISDSHEVHDNAINNNNNNIASTTTTMAVAAAPTGVNNFSNVITTRARSLAIYSKRIGLMHLRKAEAPQQPTQSTTACSASSNNNNNHGHHHHHHHDVTAPTLSSLNKQTKTHNNTLLSSTTTASNAAATNANNNNNNNNNNAHNSQHNNNNNHHHPNESRIPIVRSLVALNDLGGIAASTRHSGRGSAGGGGGTTATLPPSSSSSSVVVVAAGSAATIPPMRGAAGGGGVGGSRVPSHHHMTLRGRSRIRYQQQRQSSGEVTATMPLPAAAAVAPPCTAVTARYYRDVSAIPTISSSSSARPLAIGFDLNSNPLVERCAGGRRTAGGNNNSNNNNNSSNNNTPSASDLSDPPTPTNPTLHTNFSSSASPTPPPPSLPPADTNRLRSPFDGSGRGAVTPTPTAGTGIPVHLFYQQVALEQDHSHQHHHHHHHHHQQHQQDQHDHLHHHHHHQGSPQQPLNGGGAAAAAATKRNKRSLSSTRLGKDKCDEYNTKLLRKTTANTTATSTTPTTSCGGSCRLFTTTTTAAIQRRPPLTSAISTTSSAPAAASTSAAAQLAPIVVVVGASTVGGGATTGTAAASVGQRHGKYTPTPSPSALAEREQQQQQLTLKLRKKISY